MATIAGKRGLYIAEAAFEVDLKTMLQPVVSRARDFLLRYAPAGGAIPVRFERDVRAAIGQMVSDIFTVPANSSPYSDGRAPFAADGVSPLSPYARALNRRIGQATAAVVQGHYKYLKQRLPADLFQMMQQPRAISETVEIFSRNPLAQYQPAHTWVDPRGYRLSDRIWNTSVETRSQIDRLLTEAIRSGRGALSLSRELEQFLLPGRAALRTRMPYGTDASYRAMTLARSEIARAHSQAAFASAYANPFVDGMDWGLSARHPKIDVCDSLATLSMSRARIRPAYPLDQAPMVVSDSHPNCICYNSPHVAEDPQTVIDDLRERFALGERPYINPTTPRGFLRAMLGPILVGYAFEFFTEEAAA